VSVARRRLLTIEEIRTALAENPKRIRSVTARLPAARLHAEPAADEWSANDVLAHLRACADVWGNAIATILAEDAPTLRGVNPRTWIRETNYPELKFRPSLRAYAEQRAGLLARLAELPPADWEHTATVHAWGQVYERSLHEYADQLARHEGIHVKQIESIVAAVR